MDLVEGKDLGRVLRHRPLKDEDLWTCGPVSMKKGVGISGEFLMILMGHSVVEVFFNFCCFLHFLIWSIVLGSSF